MKLSLHQIRQHRNLSIALLLVAIAALSVGFFILSRDELPEQPETQSVTESQNEVEPARADTAQAPVEPVAEKTKEQPSNWPVVYTNEQSASITVVVNKKHRLPSTYAPSLQSVAGGQMRPEAAQAMQELLTAAENAGNSMSIVSSYRSYQTQVSTYQYWVDQHGQAEADRESARAGHSEHQTGLAADLGNPDGSCRLLACFGTGAAGVWLATHAHEYGFIIRYPQNRESETGYMYEPWHVRYLGKDVAAAVYASGKTLDEYYAVTAGDYN